jgi:hypothetical protein
MGVIFDPVLAQLRTKDAAAGGGQTLVTKVVASSGGDYTTLSAALAAASAGWIIYVMPGTYTEGGVTSFALANVSVIGLNPEQTLLNFGANSWTNTTAHFLHIEGVKLSFSTGKLGFSSTTDVEIINCHFAKTGNGLGFDGASTARLLFSNCQYISSSTDTATRSFYISASPAGCRIVGNYFKANASFTNQAHIDFATATSVISGNSFEYNGTGTEYLVKLSGASNSFTDNNINQTSASLKANLWVNAAHNAVAGNYIGSAGLIGLLCDATENTITGNTIETNSTAASTGVKIGSSSGTYSTVTGNHIRAATDGIGVDVAVTNVLVSSNTFVSTGTGVNVSVADVSVIGNFWNFGATIGITTTGARTHIASNKIYTNTAGANGISLGSADNCVTGNSLRGGGTAGTGVGINVVASNDNNVITGNRPTNWLTGIKVNTGDTNTVVTGNNTQGNGTGFTDAGTTTVNSGNA